METTDSSVLPHYGSPQRGGYGARLHTAASVIFTQALGHASPLKEVTERESLLSCEVLLKEGLKITGSVRLFQGGEAV